MAEHHCDYDFCTIPHRRPSSSNTNMSSSSNENLSPFSTRPNLRMPSPRRRPLDERTSSERNTRVLSSIRMVEEPDATTYTKTPYPNHPSQILPPRSTHRGYNFEGRGSQGTRVSDGSSTTRVPSSETSNPTESLVPKPLQVRKGDRASASSTNSDVDTMGDWSAFAQASLRLSQDTSPMSSPTLSRPLPSPGPRLSEEVPTLQASSVPQDAQILPRKPVPREATEEPRGRAERQASTTPWNAPVDRAQTIESGLGVVEEEPEQPSHITIRRVNSSEAGPSHPPLASQNSKVSLASSGSSDTLILHYGVEDSDSSSSNLPLPPPPVRQAKRPAYAYPQIQKRASSSSTHQPRPILRASSESLTSSESLSSFERPRSSSAPFNNAHVALTARTERAAVVQYPEVRAPSATSERAVSSETKSKRLARMTDHFSRRPWNTQLSTIPSESERNSQITADASATVSPVHSRDPNADMPHGYPILEDVAIPQRTLSNVRPHDWRDSDEHHDVVTELQSALPLRQQRSGYLRRHPSDARSRDDPSRPSSSSSDLVRYVASSIPQWARYYYRRGEVGHDLAVGDSRDGESRRDSVHSTDAGSMNDQQQRIYMPRTRPRARNPETDSLAISEISTDQHQYVLGRPRRPLNESFTPRLRRDRRAVSRISVWRAPSLDDAVGFFSWSRINRQVLLFCFGFLFPPLWIMAAILPIVDPLFNEKGATPSQLEIEAAMSSRTNQTEEIRYHKARWWRNLNRIMSVVGIALITTIIVLAIFAARA